MNPDQLKRFSQQAADQRAKLFRTRILFRDVPLEIAKPTVDPQFVLEGGGYRKGAVFRLRLPAAVQPPPSEKERITEIATGASYVVTSCSPAPVDCGHAQEHIVTAKLI